jgi:flagellar hook-length control protein FliK
LKYIDILRNPEIGPLLANLFSRISLQEAAVVSVTSDVTAGASYQPAPSKSARPQPSQSSDDFGALVDSNMPTDPTSAQQPAPEPTAAQRPSNDAPPADKAPPRDSATAGADRTPPANSDDHATDPRQSDNNVTDAKGSPDGPQHGGPKSGTSKSDPAKTGDSKTADKPSPGSKADQPTSKPQDATAAITTDAIAVALPVNPPLTNTPATPSTDSNPNAPLAIASAAIAASAAVTAAAKPPAQTKTGSAPGETTTADVTAEANVTAAGKAPTASGKQEAVDTAKVETTAETTFGTAIPVTAKPASLQTPATPVTKVSSSPKLPGAKDTAGTADQPGAPTRGQPGDAASQSAPAAKPDSGVLADAAKAATKANGSDATAPASAMVSSHDHAPTSTNVPSSPMPVDPTAQATAMTQPQFSVAPTAAANVTVAAANGAPVPVSGLALEIAASVQSGKTRFEVRLDPADLGRIDVRIDVDRNGQVTSHLTVEKPETLSMLRQDAPQLQQALNDAGLKTSNGSLQFSLRDQSSSGQQNNNQSGGNAQRLVITEEDNQAAAVAGRSYGRTLSASGGVDIRV